MAGRKRTSLMAITAGIALAGAIGCDNPEAGQGPAPGASFTFPSNGMEDWVSYAHQVSVVEVTSDEELPPPEEVLERGEGYIGRSATFRIVDTIWVADGHDEVDGSVEMTVTGWIMRDGERTPLQEPQYEPGEQYLVPLAESDRGWASMSHGVVPVSGERLAADLGFAERWLGDWEDGEIAGFANELATTEPDRLAEEHSHLEGEARADAVRRARGEEDANE